MPRPTRNSILWSIAGAVAATGIGIQILHSQDPLLTPPGIVESELLALLPSLTLPVPDEVFRELDHPPWKQRAQLGRKIFHDPAFSVNAHISCASCHQPDRSFTDGRPTAVGIGVTTRNTPPLLNLKHHFWFFWDGRSATLATQALGPLENALEHGIDRVQLARIASERYGEELKSAFQPLPQLTGADDASLRAVTRIPTVPESTAAYALATLGSVRALTTILLGAQLEGVTPARFLVQKNAISTFDASPTVNLIAGYIGSALAAYQEGLVTGASAFDRFARRARALRGLTPALGDGFGEAELRGLKIFAGRGRCIACHHGPTFSDQQFHNIGLAYAGEAIDLGRARGAALIKDAPDACPRADETSASPLESCQELPYLDLENIELVGAFKTPTLRNVTKTAPYMHDGRLKTLRDVLEHYSNLDEEPAVGHRAETLQPLHLTSGDMDDLQKFLAALDAEVEDLTLRK